MKPIYIISPVSGGECRPDENCPDGCGYADEPGCPVREHRNWGTWRAAVRNVIEVGGIPVGPQWLVLDEYLNDTDPNERKAGMRIGEGLMRLLGLVGEYQRNCYGPCVDCILHTSVGCESLQAWIFGCTNKPQDTRIHEIEGHYVSAGMKAEIELARELEIDVVWKGYDADDEE